MILLLIPNEDQRGLFDMSEIFETFYQSLEHE